MQSHVAKGAPYLALDIFDIEEIKLNQLPEPYNKKTKRIAGKTIKLLLEAIRKDHIFSESSTSRSSTLRSSIVEFPY